MKHSNEALSPSIDLIGNPDYQSILGGGSIASFRKGINSGNVVDQTNDEHRLPLHHNSAEVRMKI